jgi:hypothetical protein
LIGSVLYRPIVEQGSRPVVLVSSGQTFSAPQTSRLPFLLAWRLLHGRTYITTAEPYPV